MNFSQEESPFGSLGWLIDRTTPGGEVIGSGWLVKDGTAISAAHCLLPYIDLVEAVAFEIPGTGERFGVREIAVHGLFDPWMAKRTASQAGLWPPLELAGWRYNVAAVELLPSMKPMNKDTPARITRASLQIDSDREPDLTGQANRVQITTILQTLINARNLGTLCLRDARNRTVARFYMSDSKLTHIQYKQYQNEAALTKLLSSDDGDYNFFFFREIDPEWINFPPAQQTTAGMLMNAYSAMEEAIELYESLGGDTALAIQTAASLSVGDLPPDARVAVACIWNHIKYGVPLPRLLKSCSFDGRSILLSIKYLVDTGQATITQVDPVVAPGSAPLNMADKCEARRGHEIFALSVDPKSRGGILESGYVLDVVEGSDNTQFVHSIGLPLEAIGSPIIMNQQVVGIHAGPMIQGSEPYREWIHPGLFISSEAVYDCLGIKPPGAPAAPASAPTMEVSRPDLDDFDTADSAATSNEFEALASEDEGVETKTMGTISGLFTTMKGMFQSVAVKGEGLEVSLLRQGLDSEKYDKVSMETGLRVGDTIRLRVRALSPCYLAVLYASGNGQNHLLLYPETLPASASLMKGASETIPNRMISIRQPAGNRSFSGLPIGSGGEIDELFVLYSEQDFIPETIMGKAVEDVTPALSALLKGTAAMEFLRISHSGGELKRAREGDPKSFFAGRVLLQLKS
ncbi:MAG: hypothetical protein AB7W16_23275 [Candidatus Obscuribacterales bacterium]